MRPKLTYANVMATIAVFIALGGSAYAFRLGKNSVGSKQLKKNAVTTAKIKKEAVTAAKVKKGTLTGTQIDASTLGTIPSASHAASADTANGLSPPEPWHEVGAAGELQFQHGCKNTSSENQGVRFYKDHEGVVHLEGRYDGCIATGEIAFQLPAGFRPGPEFRQFALPGAGAAIVVWSTVNAAPALSGAVECGASDCMLNGITFRAES